MTNFSFIKIVFAGALLVFSLTDNTFAQSVASPFDLLPRIQVEASSDSLVAIAVSSNPFDIIETRPLDRPAGPQKGLRFREDKQNKPITAKEKETKYRRFLFVAILSMFIILTLVVTVFRILIEKIWKAFLNDNLLNQLHREQSSGLAFAYIILYLLFFINGGLFAFLATKFFNITISESNLYTLFLLTGGIAGFFLAKHLVLWLAGFIFPIGKEVSSYQFTILVFNIISGFFLVPVILFIAYAPEETTEYVVFGALGLLAFTYLFLCMRGLFIANRFVATHKFHFLLYLCAVEIAPLLVIFKLMTAHGGS